MNESISRLVDGEIDAGELDVVCAGLRQPDALATWTCYHVIGDTLRGAGAHPAGCGGRFERRLAAEPTVLAPPRRAQAGAATWVWAAAATLAAVAVVGWTALAVVDDNLALAKVREAPRVDPRQVRPGNVPADYLLAHQEYSPAAAIQGVGPYLRAVAAPTGDGP